MIVAWPLIAKAITTDELGVYTSPTEHIVLVSAVDPFKVKKQPPPVVYSPKMRVEPSADTGSVQGQIEAVFGVGHIMVSVARAESRFIPTAKNPKSTATGVFQILIGTWNHYGCTGSRTDAPANIACAKKIYDREGTRPWNSSKGMW